MADRKVGGRPSKVDYKVMLKLADSIQHNSTVSEACRYAKISRQTYYHHLKHEPVFSEKMTLAKENQRKAVFSFLTIH